MNLYNPICLVEYFISKSKNKNILLHNDLLKNLKYSWDVGFALHTYTF